MVAGIGVALFMLVPALAKRNDAVHEVREATRSVRQTARTRQAAVAAAVRHTTVSVTDIAVRLSRIAGARRVLALVFIGAALGAVFTAASFATLWAATLSCSVAAVVSLIANRSLARRQVALVSDQRAVRFVPKSSYRELYGEVVGAGVAASVAAVPVSAPVDDRSWTPRYMPAPLHTGHVGSLEQPVLATVRSISVQQGTAHSQAEAPTAGQIEAPIGATLDEILRRRRAV